MLSEGSQILTPPHPPKNSTYGMISLTLHPRKGKTIGTENPLVVPKDWSGKSVLTLAGERGDTVLNLDCGGGFIFKIKHFQNSLNYTLKWGDFTVCKLYHYKPQQKRKNE